MNIKTPRVVDLFSGCGGMSWGLHKSGFKNIAAFDIWDVALRTYERNHPGARIYCGDITQIDPHEVMDDLKIKPGELEVIIGGPPCQGFSKNVPASWRFLDDERNQMYKTYLSYVDAFHPHVVVIENVAEIYNAFNGVVRNEIVDTLTKWGYKTSVKIIKMSNYGIPQARRRCFFFATDTGVTPTFPKEHKKIVSAWDAISDLPIVHTAEKAEAYTNQPTNPYQRHMRQAATQLFNHAAKKLSPVQQARISSITAGQGLHDLPDHLRVKGGYSGAYGRLNYTDVAPTITRWVFHPGSGRYSHPREDRVITIREAARIQSFSDDFEFLGTYQQQAGQVGNAVPAYFMEQMAEPIRACLRGEELSPTQLDLFSTAQV